MFSLRYGKDSASYYFGYFGHVWLSIPKVILLTSKKPSCLSTGKKSVSTPLFSGDIAKICKLLILGNWACLSTQTQNDSISDSNEIQTHNHLLCKKTLNCLTKLASLAKWLSVCLQTKWLWVRISLLSLKLQIWCLLQARSSLTFRQTTDCRFTLKLIRDMIISYSHDSISL